jgi:hypothetical protein
MIDIPEIRDRVQALWASVVGVSSLTNACNSLLRCGFVLVVRVFL